jgi:hypothetical protein
VQIGSTVNVVPVNVDASRLGQDKVLAGAQTFKFSASQNPDDQVSFDGVGTKARFNFMYAIIGGGPGEHGGGSAYKLSFGRYSGASLTMYEDVRSSSRYLAVMEGAGQKICLLDVTSGTAATAKVTTMGLVVGPLEIAPGGIDKFFITSRGGVLYELDLRPSIPCNNLWPFASKSFEEWKDNPVGLIAANRDFQLRRASAANTSVPIPWLISLQQKTIAASSIAPHARVLKKILCSKPQDSGRSRNMSAVLECCVKKEVANKDGNDGFSEKQILRLKELLQNI